MPAIDPLSAGPPSQPERRSFLKKCLAAVLGGVTALVPALAGLGVLLDPLRRKGAAANIVRVATLDALPEDGVPRKFPVFASRTDAWNKFDSVPVGAVYLRRPPGKPLQAFNVVCPHAGCFVDYKDARSAYLCPCHNSTFSIDGHVADPASPSPRGLDELEVQLRNGKEIWVRFQNFRAGSAEKIPSA